MGQSRKIIRAFEPNAHISRSPLHLPPCHPWFLSKAPTVAENDLRQQQLRNDHVLNDHVPNAYAHRSNRGGRVVDRNKKSIEQEQDIHGTEGQTAMGQDQRIHRTRTRHHKSFMGQE